VITVLILVITEAVVEISGAVVVID
jgi:hypothetical protein